MTHKNFAGAAKVRNDGPRCSVVRWETTAAKGRDPHRFRQPGHATHCSAGGLLRAPTEPPDDDDIGTMHAGGQAKDLVMFQTPGSRDTRNTVGFNSH